MPRYTCRESALTTSMGRRPARATAVAVFPTPVGPAITSRAWDIGPVVLPISLELTPDVLHGESAHDGTAVRTEIRTGGRGEVGHETLHLLTGQRRVGLDGGAAGHEGHGAVHRRLSPTRPRQLVHGRFHETARLVALEQRG